MSAIYKFLIPLFCNCGISHFFITDMPATERVIDVTIRFFTVFMFFAIIESAL